MKRVPNAYTYSCLILFFGRLISPTIVGTMLINQTISHGSGCAFTTLWIKRNNTWSLCYSSPSDALFWNTKSEAKFRNFLVSQTETFLGNKHENQEIILIIHCESLKEMPSPLKVSTMICVYHSLGKKLFLSLLNKTMSCLLISYKPFKIKTCYCYYSCSKMMWLFLLLCMGCTPSTVYCQGQKRITQIPQSTM